jgi:hypothetical protein
MGLFNFFKKKSEPQSLENTVDENQLEFIQSSTANAERIVQGFSERLDNELDYSEQSLATLDELLENFADFADEMDEEMRSDLIAQAGSYIFEVARRNYGGKYYWYDQLDQPIFVTGQPNFEISLLAFEKVKQRLENGREDNIPFFFKGYSERVKQAKQGDKALII